MLLTLLRLASCVSLLVINLNVFFLLLKTVIKEVVRGVIIVFHKVLTAMYFILSMTRSGMSCHP